MNVCIYADPHVTKYIGGDIERRQSHIIETFRELYSSSADIYICLGDFFHSSRLESRDVKYISDLASIISKKTYILTGNHDRSSKDDSLINLLESMNPQYITSVDKYIRIDDSLLVSHGYLEEALASPLVEGCKYLFTHEDYADIQMNTHGRKSTTGHKIPQFTRVFNGHIHLSSLSTPLINVGSVAPVAYGELRTYEYPKYYILHTEDGSYDDHKVTTSTVLWDMTVSEYEEFCSRRDQYTGDYRIRVHYDSDKPSDPPVSAVGNVTCEYVKTLAVSPSEEGQSPRVSATVSRTISVKEYVQRYVDKVPPDLVDRWTKILDEMFLQVGGTK